MQNTVLFISTVLIWGSSWLAIKLQIGPVDVVLSIFYRFALAAALFLPYLALAGKLKAPSKWRFVALQACCLFSFNFICFYNATAYMPSGLVSVIFSLATIYNAINARIWFKERTKPRVILAGATGAIGLVLLFWNDIAVSLNTETLKGIAWAAVGTLLFSFGNMVSRRNTMEGTSPTTANAWGMGMGSIILAAVLAVTDTPLALPQSTEYWAALVYLSVFASIIGFTTYLMLVARLGSDKAAYTTVLFPVVALGLSTIYEGYIWSPTAFSGLALTMIGNLIMFAKLPSRQLARS